MTTKTDKPIIRCSIEYVRDKNKWVVEVYKNEVWQSEHWFHTQEKAMEYADKTVFGE